MSSIFSQLLIQSELNVIFLPMQTPLPLPKNHSLNKLRAEEVPVIGIKKFTHLKSLPDAEDFFPIDTKGTL